jgi:hypothetical protein
MNFWRLFGLLDQHVNQSLLFVLGLEGNNGSSGGGRSRRLDEDDLVVLLGRRHVDGLLWTVHFRFWGRDVHVDVLVDDRGLGRRAVLRRRCAVAGAGRARGTVAVAGLGAGVRRRHQG